MAEGAAHERLIFVLVSPLATSAVGAPGTLAAWVVLPSEVSSLRPTLLTAPIWYA